MGKILSLIMHTRGLSSNQKFLLDIRIRYVMDIGIVMLVMTVKLGLYILCKIYLMINMEQNNNSLGYKFQVPLISVHKIRYFTENVHDK